MIDKALYASRTEEWGTPIELFERINGIFGFRLDACASNTNAKCGEYFTKSDDGLSRDWSSYGRVWMNPPYGKQIGKWMQKAWQEAQKGSIVVALVPARTDTKWWHNWVSGKATTIFIKGRLKYLDETCSQTRYRYG